MDVGTEQSKLIKRTLGNSLWRTVFEVMERRTNGSLRGRVKNTTWDVIEDSTNNFCELKIVEKHESR